MIPLKAAMMGKGPQESKEVKRHSPSTGTVQPYTQEIKFMNQLKNGGTLLLKGSIQEVKATLGYKGGV